MGCQTTVLAAPTMIRIASRPVQTSDQARTITQLRMSRLAQMVSSPAVKACMTFEVVQSIMTIVSGTRPKWVE